MSDDNPLYRNARGLSDRYTVYGFVAIFATFVLIVISMTANLGSVTGGELNFGIVKLTLGSDWVIRTMLFLTSLMGILVSVFFVTYAMIQDRVGGYALLRALPAEQQVEFNQFAAQQVVEPMRLVGSVTRLFFAAAILLVLLHIGVFIASFWILR